jgi:enterochelin esterase family protein
MDHAVGARCRTDALTFRLRDPDRRLAGVRLLPEFPAPRDRLDFAYDEIERAWRLSLPRPAAWRMEYLLEQHYADGAIERICDPDNPRRVGGAFGDKSVLECPEYVEPAWLHLPEAPGSWRELTIRAPAVKAEISARIWSPAIHTERVVVAHDGPEYDKLAALGHYSAAMVGAGRVAPHHLVLLDPGDRNEWYSANPRYSRALAGDVLPRLYAELDTVRPVVGVGTSLGGLAMLHAQRRYPLAFAGLFLQSGSFFRPRYDSQESGFPRYRRIARFTDQVVRAAAGTTPAVPTVLTCGLVEENLSNNREMAQALRAQEYPVQLFEVPDAHNFTGWRDAFDPHLTDLLRRIWQTA